MTIHSGEPAIVRNGAVARLLAPWVRDAQAPWAALLTLAGIPVLMATWAMLTPPNVLSTTMTQDLLFNLSGAWQVHTGQVPHVDFHEPSGRLSFLLTALGMRLLGPGPFAFLVNMAIAATMLFIASFLAARRRLPLLPAALFVLYVSLLTLMPANVGDRPDHYTFAMSYNRYCWGAYSILALILFVPPRGRVNGTAIDLGVAAGVLAMMFYLKITYFVAGLGTIGVAALLHPHVSRHWPAWLALSALLLANALAPYNRAYLVDIEACLASGAIRTGIVLHLKNFVAAIGQYAPYLAAVAIAFGMWWLGRASLRLLLTLVFLLGASLLLLSQNSQAAGLPTGVVMLMVLYDELRCRFSSLRNRDLAPLLMTLLIFPFFSASAFAASIAGYHANAHSDKGLFVVERTNLRGLAVPSGDLGAFMSFSRKFDYPARPETPPRDKPLYQLTDYEYVLVLLEAADMLHDRPPGGIALLDAVNPLPFMLGWGAARGANLWSTWNAPVRPAADYLADVRYVLVPKFSLNPDWTRDLMRLYGDYVAEHFRWGAETRCWILLTRSPSELTTSTSEGDT